MPRPIPTLTALLAAGWLAACSTTPDTQSTTDQGTASRQIELAVPAPVDGGVASDLEVGRSAGVPVRAVPALRRTQTPKVAPAPLTELAAPVSALSPVVTTPSDAALDLVAVPVAQPQPEPETTGGLGSGRDQMIHAMHQGDGMGADPGHSGTGGGPTIILRGGMGGVHDKCDLRPRGFAGGGIAINRLAPGLGSYGRGPVRGGIR